MLIALQTLEESAKRYALLQAVDKEHLKTLNEESLIDGDLLLATGKNILGDQENIDKRIKMLKEIKTEPVDFALERAIGRNDSVYSNFIELTANAKNKVGRIAIKNGNRNLGFATGFMVSDRLLLTNWHVFKEREAVAESEIQFFYELDLNGSPGTPTIFKLDTNDFFFSSSELDYCLVAVNRTDITGKIPLGDIGYIFLDPTLGKLGNENQEALNIIHHPDGDYKQLSIRENLFTKITDTAIWYESDTAPGSSGSPVFNDQWQVVALHHMGVGKKNANGDYIDKYGNPIPVTNKTIDTSKIIWIANEGIRISVILTHIFSNFQNMPILEGLKVSTAIQTHDIKPLVPQRVPNDHRQNINPTEMDTNNLESKVNISFPASLIGNNGVININISNQGSQIQSTVSGATTSAANLNLVDELAETKKLEQSTDYSNCRGYQAGFLGTNIQLPQPNEKLRKFIAKVQGTDGMVLKYHHYSVLFHTVRMMPVISAINIDGDLNKRKDETGREDTWLRDTRLDFDIQLNDKYYNKSGFDRGHMSRREDANWGRTPKDAKLFADLTCVYTNACPQVKTLNRSGDAGLWGKLETIVLEKGAILEDASTRKISVFNGPIFKDDDPVFRGIQVPLNFYKIVLWLTDDKELRATAFKLSQVDLVGDIDFEQLDIDQDATFKEFQIDIRDLGKQTQLDFSAIEAFDTFNGEAGNEIVLETVQEVRLHVNKSNATKKTSSDQNHQ